VTDEARMCTDKKRYESRQAAWFFALTDGLRSYRCPLCGGWHLTSSNVRRGRPMKRARR
jgi:hypothetical protein